MSPFYWIAVAVVIVLASARLTRLATYDKFPPTAWARERFIEWADKTDRRRKWQLLAFCPYCASFWITLLVMALGYLAGVFDGYAVQSWMTPTWWLFMGLLGASYLAAMVMVFDGDNGEDD